MQPNRVHRDRLPNVDPCPIPLWGGEPCGKPNHPVAPFAICGDHARKLYEAFDSYIGGVTQNEIFRASMALDWLEDHRRKEATWAKDDELALVYYVQIGEHIKVGYTTNLTLRLRSYPPYRRLLATEPGGRSLEGQRLREFKHLVDAGQEWLRPGPDLIAHINELRAADGTAPIQPAA